MYRVREVEIGDAGRSLLDPNTARHTASMRKMRHHEEPAGTLPPPTCPHLSVSLLVSIGLASWLRPKATSSSNSAVRAPALSTLASANAHVLISPLSPPRAHGGPATTKQDLLRFAAAEQQGLTNVMGAGATHASSDEACVTRTCSSTHPQVRDGHEQARPQPRRTVPRSICRLTCDVPKAASMESRKAFGIIVLGGHEDEKT